MKTKLNNRTRKTLVGFKLSSKPRFPPGGCLTTAGIARYLLYWSLRETGKIQNNTKNSSARAAKGNFLPFGGATVC